MAQPALEVDEVRVRGRLRISGPEDIQSRPAGRPGTALESGEDRFHDGFEVPCRVIRFQPFGGECTGLEGLKALYGFAFITEVLARRQCICQIQISHRGYKFFVFVQGSAAKKGDMINVRECLFYRASRKMGTK